MKKRNKLWIVGIALIAVILVAAIAVAVLWNINEYTVSLAVEGEAKILLECGDEFVPQPASATVYGSLLQKEGKQVDVTVEDNVDPSCPGIYEATYRVECDVEFLFFREKLLAEETRIVEVVDTREPIIRLKSDPSVHVLPGEAYVEEGYTAIDACDGDLTAAVESRVEGNEVIYSVTDAAGNTTFAVRRIKYRDTVAPELSLQGRHYMFLKVGQPYEEPGFSAVDADEGDVGALVSVTGTIDPDAVGLYELKYTVSDSYGNTSSVIRKVRVTDAADVPEIPMWDPQNPVSTNGRVIYLTFDDGPGPHTERLLDVLDLYGIKATFFVVNTGNMEILSRMAASGHTVAMHSATHRYDKIYASEAAYYDDLYKIQNTIYTHTGILPRILRFPGGTSNTVSTKHAPGLMTQLSRDLKAMGYRYFDWNVDSRDASDAKSMEEVYTNVIKGCSGKDFSVVLQHDTMGFSVDAVELIIQWGLSSGYTFLPLDASSPVCEHKALN